jgi:hypothetical protein
MRDRNVAAMPDLNTLPSHLPRPVDDGACAHLTGMTMPAITLQATQGAPVNLGALPPGRTVIYCYPRTGTPAEALPESWDEIPGARVVRHRPAPSATTIVTLRRSERTSLG